MSAEGLYLSTLEWHRREPPEANRRPAALLLGQGEPFPHYQLAELPDGGQIIAPVLTLPTLTRGRVIAVERERRIPELGRYVIHVGLALSGLASWPLLWRLDPSRIEYENEFRLLTTPGTSAWVGDSIDAGVRRVWRHLLESERLHVHLVDAWQEDDERLPLLRPGQRVEIYGPVAALAVTVPESGACEILFSEVDPPECWCIHPLSIKFV